MLLGVQSPVRNLNQSQLAAPALANGSKARRTVSAGILLPERPTVVTGMGPARLAFQDMRRSHWQAQCVCV